MDSKQARATLEKIAEGEQVRVLFNLLMTVIGAKQDAMKDDIFALIKAKMDLEQEGIRELVNLRESRNNNTPDQSGVTEPLLIKDKIMVQDSKKAEA